jgi:hypothetical protein
VLDLMVRPLPPPFRLEDFATLLNRQHGREFSVWCLA